MILANHMPARRLLGSCAALGKPHLSGRDPIKIAGRREMDVPRAMARRVRPPVRPHPIARRHAVDLAVEVLIITLYLHG